MSSIAIVVATLRCGHLAITLVTVTTTIFSISGAPQVDTRIYKPAFRLAMARDASYSIFISPLLPMADLICFGENGRYSATALNESL